MAAQQSTMDIAIPAPPPPWAKLQCPWHFSSWSFRSTAFPATRTISSASRIRWLTTSAPSLLFVLPASGLVDDCVTIAAIRHGQAEDKTPIILFICLAQDGTTIRVEQPSEHPPV